MWFFAWTLVGGLFHQSVLLFIALVPLFVFRFTPFWISLLAIALFLGDLALEPHVLDRYSAGYIRQVYVAKGALFRIAPNAAAGMILLLFRYRFEGTKIELRFWTRVGSRRAASSCSISSSTRPCRWTGCRSMSCPCRFVCWSKDSDGLQRTARAGLGAHDTRHWSSGASLWGPGRRSPTIPNIGCPINSTRCSRRANLLKDEGPSSSSRASRLPAEEPSGRRQPHRARRARA